MNATDFDVRYNAMTVSSIASFAGVTGRMNGGCKDVYFLRGIGCNATYAADIEKMDTLLLERQMAGRGVYLRLAALLKPCRLEDTTAFSAFYDSWRQCPDEAPRLPVAAQNVALGQALAQALSKVLAVFRLYSPGVTASIEKNFVIKLLFWVDQALDPLLAQWSAGMAEKFVYTGPVKKPEYLFCYLLTLLGIDVLILSPGGPIDLEPPLLALSGTLHLGAAGDAAIPAFNAERAQQQQPKQPARPAAPEQPGASGHKVDIRRPDREAARPPQAVPASAPATAVPARAPVIAIPARPSPIATPASAATGGRRELEFEQLAQLASSIVMIEVHGPKGQVISTGSGIMISAAGYILTNHHVACKGSGFSIHIEDDEAVYHTDEVIKTHALLDLALIRIQHTLRPIPVYQQAAPLVRGQKVVAIGSPLGLFNSVSDGIISGFRTIGDVDMIQFTAPISPGSSGGAVLNMFGEVIGISTAGIDRGQNLNLAVGCQSILPFIRGFTK